MRDILLLVEGGRKRPSVIGRTDPCPPEEHWEVPGVVHHKWMGVASQLPGHWLVLGVPLKPMKPRANRFFNYSFYYPRVNVINVFSTCAFVLFLSSSLICCFCWISLSEDCVKRLKTSEPTGGSRVLISGSYSCTRISLVLFSSCLDQRRDAPEASFCRVRCARVVMVV